MPLMDRDLDKLTGRTFDVLVVGGGIYGLTIAYDAASRGLSVALVERDDFGSGSSFNHLRTIHGGLRYLQSLDFVRARESVVERRTLARIAPHAVRPMPFVLPLSRSVTRGQVDSRLEAVGVPARMPLLKAMNLVTSRDAAEPAIGGRAAQGGNLFLVPWRGRALFGTWESARPVSAADTRVCEEDVLQF